MVVRRTQKETQQRAPFWLAALLVLNLVLMSVDARDTETKQRMIRVWAQTVVAPFEQASSSVGGAGLGFFRSLANFRQAAVENEELKTRLAEAETRARDGQAAQIENQRLKNLLSFRESGGYETIPAKVIARDASAWFDAVWINRGKGAGVELGMPVATPEGVVGRVVALGPISAQIMLVTDERSGVGAIVGRLNQSNAFGSIRGLGDNGLLEMRFVPGAEAVAKGDTVTTTGQDKIYPPGLTVGRVVEVKTDSANAPHVIYIQPGAPLQALEEVMVLRYRAPRNDAPEESLPNIDKGRK